MFPCSRCRATRGCDKARRAFRRNHKLHRLRSHSQSAPVAIEATFPCSRCRATRGCERSGRHSDAAAARPTTAFRPENRMPRFTTAAPPIAGYASGYRNPGSIPRYSSQPLPAVYVNPFYTYS
ncbi:hypothetical protein C4K10_0272 [Pseudomonas chlororaphis subsp. aureofaciens]|nr:hypothetical protein C4K10_0272 [Pseudomonas chlororaphis subsp. aureofaciens]